MREVARLLVPPIRWDPLRGLGAAWPAVERALDAGVGGFMLDGIPTSVAANLAQRIRDRADEAPLLVADPALFGDDASAEEGLSLPPLAALAALRDTHALRRAARATARAVRRAGCNTMLAPSADVAGVPRTDTFGADPNTVALALTEWIDAAQADGVLCCAGSFPGAGRITDPRSTSVVRAAEDALYATDLVPFRAAIDAGVAAISMAVAGYPALDGSGVPASLSARVIGRVLRGELGFDGLVVADGRLLDTRAGRPVPACDLASAGVDVIVRSDRLDVELRALLDAVQQGRLHRARVHDAAWRRRTRAELASAPLPFETFRTEDAEWLDELAERTIVVVRGRAVRVVAPIELAIVGGAPPPDPATMMAAFANGVAQAGGDGSSVRHASAPLVTTRSALVVIAAAGGDYAAWTSGTRAANELATICAEAHRSRRDVAVIWCGHPDATPEALDADLLIACWSPSGAMLRACGRWLMRRV